MNVNYEYLLISKTPLKLARLLNINPQTKFKDYITNFNQDKLLTKFNHTHPFQTNLAQGRFLMFCKNPVNYVRYFWDNDEKELDDYLNIITKNRWSMWKKN